MAELGHYFFVSCSILEIDGVHLPGLLAFEWTAMDAVSFTAI